MLHLFCLWVQRLDQRDATYIVISKPKRISVAFGVSQFMFDSPLVEFSAAGCSRGIYPQITQ